MEADNHNDSLDIRCTEEEKKCDSKKSGQLLPVPGQEQSLSDNSCTDQEKRAAAAKDDKKQKSYKKEDSKKEKSWRSCPGSKKEDLRESAYEGVGEPTTTRCKSSSDESPSVGAGVPTTTHSSSSSNGLEEAEAGIYDHGVQEVVPSTNLLRNPAGAAQPVTIPGALRVTPGLEPIPLDPGAYRPPMPAYQPPRFRLMRDSHANTTDGLPSAMPVEGQDDDMPHAQPVAPKDSDQPSIRRYLVIFGYVAFVALLVVVVLAIQQALHQKKTATGAVYDLPPTWNQSTIPPVGFADRVHQMLGTYLDDSTLRAIQDFPRSPQARAYQWLLEDLYQHSSTLQRRRQRFALATFFYATNGHDWLFQDNWLGHNISECLWFSRVNTTCWGDDDDNVWLQMLCLYDNNVGGEIPPELALLSDSLTSIQMRSNRFSTIPTELASLTNLVQLDFQLSEMTGTFPTELGLLTKLEYLNFASNPGMHGTIPTEFALLTNLRRMYLFKSGLTGTLMFEYLGKLKNLQSLFLYGNKMVCDLSSGGGLWNMSQLEKLHLSRNSFAGTTIPSEIGVLTNLMEFNMRNTSVTGPIPKQLWDLDKLKILELDGNLFTGPLLSPNIGQLTGLEGLYLSANPKAKGTIPSTIGLLTDLTVLTLHDIPNLTGTLPTEMRWLSSKLNTMTLTNTKLEGSIPDELCKNATHAWLYCKLSQKIQDIPNPELAGTCFQRYFNYSLNSLKKCDQTLLCGCDCGNCG